MAFQRFADFYPYYLGEHQNRTCRRLHVVGTTAMVTYGVLCAATGHYAALFAMPLIGYGFAWVGHFGFEHNRPATFRHPWYSLAGDFVMARDVLTGRLPW